MNRLLLRQIKKNFGGIENIPSSFLPFVEAVNNSYQHYEDDRLLFERAMAISSEELSVANEQLRQETAAQRAILSKLKSTLQTVLSIREDEGELTLQADEDLLNVATHLEEHVQKVKEYERRLVLIHKFIDQSTDAIKVADEAGNLIFLNEKARTWLKKPISELIHKKIYEADPNMGEQETWQNVQEQLLTKPHIVMERQQTNEFDALILAESILKKIWVNDKKYIICVTRDISERQEAQQEREALIQKLQDANKELEDFAYIVSHDLKAPLRGITTLVTWLLQDYADSLDAEGKDLMALLNKRVERMQNLIDGILRYARVGYQKAERKTLDLQSIVSEVIEFIAPPPHISVRIVSPLPQICNDDTQIRQLFQNFISNAVKYNDKAAGIVEISFLDLDTHWQFCVADNGPGIDPKYHEKIFQIFQTLQSKDEYESTGIGLTIVSKIIAQNEGEVRVDSAVGAGAKFFFTLKK